MKFLYFLDCYADGGAELGLATLVENGFFENHEVSICAVTGKGTSYERLKASSIPRHVLRFCGTRPFNTWSVLLSIFPLLRFIWRERPDIMIISLARANLIGRFASIFFPSMKVITFEHNTHYRNRLTHLLRYTSHWVDGVLVDHHETWDKLRNFFYPNLASDRSFYVPLVTFPAVTATILENASPRKEGGLVRIMSAGRLTAQKNYVELLYAIRSLLDAGHNVELFIAGKGELEEELRETVVMLGLQDHVSLPGFLKDWTSRCAEFDVYVQPSVHEGLCISVLEAMAQGMLVVASDVGGIRQYGRDNVNMIKIQGITRKEIAGALAAAMALDGAAASQLRRNAVLTVKDEFGPAAVTRQWNTAMQNLVKLASRQRDAPASLRGKIRCSYEADDQEQTARQNPR